MKNKWKAVLCAALMCVSGVAVLPQTAYALTTPNTMNSEEEQRIYRVSVEGNAKGNTNWDFVYALTAYDTGRIHIDVQCLSVNGFYCNEIGDIAFNDSMIAPIGEQGANGISKFNKVCNGSKYIVSYFADKIIYTAVFPDCSSSYSGSTLMSFDFYVKEPYLHTNQELTLFGENIGIPFGDDVVEDKQELLDILNDLETQNNSLSDEVARLTEENNSLYSQLEYADNMIAQLSNNTVISLDINNDESIDALDASILLTIYAINSTSTDGSMISSYNEYLDYVKTT